MPRALQTVVKPGRVDQLIMASVERAVSLYMGPRAAPLWDELREPLDRLVRRKVSRRPIPPEGLRLIQSGVEALRCALAKRRAA